MTKILFTATNTANAKGLDETGVTLEEYAIAYLIFKSTGYEIETASIKGGLCPIDINSMSCSNPDEWDECIKILRNTKKLDEINPDDFDVIYFVGGHGAMFDFPNNEKISCIVKKMNEQNKIIAAICHGASAFVGIKDNQNNYLIEGKRLTSFTNKEEKIVKTQELMPFSLQDELVSQGAYFVEAKPWAEHVEIDGNLITGQNNKSVTMLAEKIIEALNS